MAAQDHLYIGYQIPLAMIQGATLKLTTNEDY